MRADFYLITQPRFRDNPLSLVYKLVIKAHNARMQTNILVQDQGQAEQVDDDLWDLGEDIFIPHQIAGQDDDTEVPILIVPPEKPVSTRELAINLREQAVEDRYARVLEVVPANPDARTSSRARWRAYKQAGWELNKFDM